MATGTDDLPSGQEMMLSVFRKKFEKNPWFGLYYMDEWNMTADKVPGLGELLDSYKEPIIVGLLKSLRDGQEGSLASVEMTLERLRKVGATWPELDIIKRSTKADLAESDISPEEQRRRRNMLQRLARGDYIYALGRAVDVGFTMSDPWFAQLMEEIKPALIKRIRSYLGDVSTISKAGLMVNQLDQLGVEWPELRTIAAIKRKAVIVQMLKMLKAGHYWNTAIPSAIITLRQLGATWPELDIIERSAAAERERSSIAESSPSATMMQGEAIELLKDATGMWYPRDQFEAGLDAKRKGVLDELSYKITETWPRSTLAVLKTLRKMGALAYHGRDWPELKQLVEEPRAKNLVIKTLLQMLKSEDWEPKDLGEFIGYLRAIHVEWPELDVIERSIAASGRDPQRLAETDDGLDQIITDMGRGFDVLRDDPHANIFPLNRLASFERALRDGVLDPDEVRSGLDSIKSKIMVYLLTLVKFGPSAWWEVSNHIEGLDRLGIKWPELSVIHRSLSADDGVAESYESSYESDEDLLAHIEEALDSGSLIRALGIIRDHALTLRNTPGLRSLLPALLDQVAEEVADAASSGDLEAYDIEELRMQLRDLGVRVPDDDLSRAMLAHGKAFGSLLAHKVALMGKAEDATQGLIDVIDELALWGIDLGDYIPRDKSLILRMLLTFMKEGHTDVALTYIDKLRHLNITFPEYDVIQRSAQSPTLEEDVDKTDPQLLRAYFILEEMVEEGRFRHISGLLATIGARPGMLRFSPFNIDDHKDEVLEDMLYSIKHHDDDWDVNMSPEDFPDMIEGARKLGADWPELEVIERSVKTDLTEDQQPVMTVNKDGTRMWYAKDQLHRTDGPAVEYADGGREWWIDGKMHREDGPAVELPNGRREWWVNDYLHREEGPAVELPNGQREWRVNGLLHRTDGPAIERADGGREWYVDGQLHRTDGPAGEYADGARMWYINGHTHRTDGPAIEEPDGIRRWIIDGKKLTFPKWLERVKSKLDKSDIIRFLLLMIKQGNGEGADALIDSLIAAGFDYPEFEVMRRSLRSDITEDQQPVMTVTPDGSRRWRVSGKYHRTDGPAIEWADGTRQWRVNGELHRTDGPAIEWADGDRAWYIRGQLHRTDGPAIEEPDGHREWWVNDQRHRVDGPAVEYADGTRMWYAKDQLHRTDGPAVERADGSREWRVRGLLHRTDGPAIERADGYREWWIKGKELDFPQWLKRVKSKLDKSDIMRFLLLMIKHDNTKGADECIDVLTKAGFNYPEFEVMRRSLRSDITEDQQPVMSVTPDGTRWWRVNGKLHRTDGPAVEYTTGGYEWRYYGHLHRIGGPAIDWADGTRRWYVRSLLHREDGPAVEHANGEREWYINDEQLRFPRWLERVKSKLDKSDIMRFLLLMIKQDNTKGADECIDDLIAAGFNYPEFEVIRRSLRSEITEDQQPVMTVTPDGNREWRVNGKLHRTDGPALELANGNRGWFINGRPHREDGPAAEYVDGTRIWVINGLQHRTDGPAIEWANGDREWYINDEKLTFPQWLKRVGGTLEKADLIRFLLLMIKQGNARDAEGYLYYLNRAGIDYPEFEVIRRSLRSDIAEGNHTEKTLERYYYQMLREIEAEDYSEIPYYLAHIGASHMEFPNRSSLFNQHKAEIMAEILGAIRHQDRFEFELADLIKMVRGLRMMRVDWPELDTIERSLRTDSK